MAILGERLAAARAQKGLTQEELAQRAHLPRQAVSRLERGERNHIRSDVLIRLAQALEVSADYLLGLTAAMREAPLVSTPPGTRKRQAARVT